MSRLLQLSHVLLERACNDSERKSIWTRVQTARMHTSNMHASQSVGKLHGTLVKDCDTNLVVKRMTFVARTPSNFEVDDVCSYLRSTLPCDALRVAMCRRGTYFSIAVTPLRDGRDVIELKQASPSAHNITMMCAMNAIQQMI